MISDHTQRNTPLAHTRTNKQPDAHEDSKEATWPCLYVMMMMMMMSCEHTQWYQGMDGRGWGGREEGAAVSPSVWIMGFRPGSLSQPAGFQRYAGTVRIYTICIHYYNIITLLCGLTMVYCKLWCLVLQCVVFSILIKYFSCLKVKCIISCPTDGENLARRRIKKKETIKKRTCPIFYPVTWINCPVKSMSKNNLRVFIYENPSSPPLPSYKTTLDTAELYHPPKVCACKHCFHFQDCGFAVIHSSLSVVHVLI